MYKLIANSTSIKRLSDGATIPDNPTLGDWQEYQDWLALGNIPEPADIIPEHPITEIDMRRARLALLQTGLLDDVESAIAAMTGDEGRAAQINWEYATVLKRNDALVGAIATGLGLTEADLDELFELAATL